MLQSLTALPEKISGYDLANHLLSQGGVEALIRYAGNAETDWLELKAGMCLLPEDRKKGETERDLYWNIAKEVIALMNTSGGALVIGIHDKTLNLVPLEENDPRHVLAEKGIDGYVREFVRSNVWPSSLSWTYRGKTWELADKQVPMDLISYHHAPYSGPDGRTGEVVVLLVKPSEKIRLAKEDRKSSVLLKRTRGEVGEAVPIYDYDEFDKYKVSREVVSAFYAKVRYQFDREHAAASDSAKLNAAIQDYYSGLAIKARKMMAVFTPLDAEENVFSKDDVDQFYSPEAIETFDDEDRWLDDDDHEEEEREDDEEEDEEGSDLDEDGDEGALDSEDDTEDVEDARSARKGDLLELLKSEQRVIVSGEPGGGKTTCLTYFTLKFAERGDGAPILAVFIPMGQWRRGGSLSLMMERATGMDAGPLAHLMSENRLRLVIDAVNECPDDFRVAAIQNIGIFLAEHPTVPAVISTRHSKELCALHLPVFHVQPMDETHRLHYLERYLQDGEQAQKLLRQLSGMPGGETVAENPMLLRLVVEVYKESPEKCLPTGRAGLYRRSLRAWYKRENEKAEKAGEKLQWNRHQTFELLAVLAFKSRQRGYRDVPREEVLAIWGADAENQLEALCQGPIIYCDDEFVRFRHETFQEYLCAEYLVAHEDELPSWTQDDYAQWGMPFAYAVELFELDKQQLPESFWLAAWNLNPWLGVALTDRSAGRQFLNPRYHGTRPKVAGQPLDGRSRTPYLRAVCGTFDNWALRHALCEDDVSWYKRGDVALRYVVFISRDCQSRWNNFERSLLHCFKGLWDKHAVKLAKSWLTLSNPRDLFQYYAPEDWDGWIENASPNRAESLVNVRLALPEDFKFRLSEWLKDRSIPSAITLVRAGLATKTDFGNEHHKWVTFATPHMAAELMEAGLMSPSDFSSRLMGWLQHPQYSFVRKYLKISGELESIRRNNKVVQKWVAAASMGSAALLIEDGLSTKEGFADKIHEWLVFSNGPERKEMLRWHLIDKQELIGFENNLVVIRQACDDVKNGIKIASEFASEKSAWIKSANLSVLVRLLQVGIVTKEETEDLIKQWIDTAVPEFALRLIKQNMVSKDDFVRRKSIWKQLLEPAVARKLIKENIICREDVVGEREWWKTIVEPKTLPCVIKLGCMTLDDAIEYLDTWGAAVPDDVRMQLKGLTEIAKLHVGQVVHGRVKSITDYGAFIDFDGINGLLHITEMSWGRVKHPSELLKVGQELDVMVLDVDRDKERISLGLKQMTENPWPTIIEQFSVNSRVKGKVRNLTNYGALIELEEGIDGKIHISDMSWSRKVNRPSECLNIGDEVEAIVLNVDPEKRQIRLGLKQAQQNPWPEIFRKYAIGMVVTGRVVSVASFGAFVELEPGVDGLIHVSQISNKAIEKSTEALSVGEEVTARVIKVDREACRIALSINALAMTEEELKSLKDNNEVVAQESKGGTTASGTSSQVSTGSNADTNEVDLRS